jgi:hypothetical protein
MITFKIVIKEHPSGPKLPVTVSVQSRAEEDATEGEMNCANVVYESVKLGMTYLQTKMGGEQIHGADSDGLKAQIFAMLQRHGVKTPPEEL